MLRRLTGRGSASPSAPDGEGSVPHVEAEVFQAHVTSSTGETLVYRYEDILRAVGRFIDEEQLTDVVIVQTETGVLVRGMRRPHAGTRLASTFCERLFSKAEIAAILEEGRRRRGTGSKLFQ